MGALSVFGALPALAQTASAPAGAPPASRSFTVYFDYETDALTASAQDVAKAAAAAYRSTGATSVQVVGHTDTAEADLATWRSDIKKSAPACRKLPAKTRAGYPICTWPRPNAIAFGLLRAKAVAAALVANGVPKSAIHVSSAGSSDPFVPTPAATREPLNRGTAISIQ